MHRLEATIDATRAAPDARTAPVSISSEYPVDRGGYLEVLSHHADAVDLSRAPLPLLEAHDDRRLPVGVVEDLRIAGGRLRGVLRLGKSARAAELWDDIREGVLRALSVGYEIQKMENGPGPITRTATRWRPVEASLVAVPADPTVGINRSHTVNENTSTETRIEPGRDRGAERTERERCTEIAAMGRHYKLDDLAGEHIEKGTTVEQFRGVLLERIASRGPRAINPDSAGSMRVGMNARERASYSVARILRAQIDPAWGARHLGLEREVSDELARQSGREPRGLFVPLEIKRRDLTVGTATAGGHLRPTDHLGDQYVEALRAQPIVGELGATMLTGLSGNVAIPAADATTTTYWLAENTAPTEGAPTFRQITMSPKTIGAYVDMSRRLVLQSSPDIETVIRNDLQTGVSVAIDDAAIEGGGTNQPTGILGTSGIGAVALGTNGGAPTWASVVNLVKEVAVDNALMGALAFAGTPAARSKMMQTAKVASTDSVMIQEDPERLVGYRFVASNSVPSDLSKGGGSSLSALIFGNWRELFLGQWGAVDVLVDPYSLSATGAVRITIFADVDVAVRHAQSFAAIKDMITT